MEGPGPGPGPEVKRPRLDTYNDGSYRLQQQQPPPIAPSHSYSSHPPPPRNHYPHGAPPPPPSPYYEPSAHDHNRALPDPTGYTQSQSGHNTPAREQRHYADSYSRRGSASAATRSPDGYQQYPGGRALNSAGTNDGHYPATYSTDAAGHAVGYPNTDGPMNGSAHHGLPMSAYPDNPHAVLAARPEYSQSPVSATPHPYPGGGYGPQTSYQIMQRSKKGNRATQACDVCRQRKAKCDEGRPKCSFCVENQMPCNYQNVAPAKADRANQAIMDQLAVQDVHLRAQDDHLRAQDEKFDRFEATIERIEKLLMGSGAPVSASITGERSERKSISRQILSLESPQRKVTPDQKVPPHALAHISGFREPKVEASPSGSHATSSTDSVGIESGSANPINVPVEHTTAAHRLLSWSSVKRLLGHQRTANGHSLNEDYVMHFEEERGVLRVYGCGEGRDSGDGGQPGAESPPNQGSSGQVSTQSSGSPSGRSDEPTDTSSPASPPEGLWGYGFVPPVTTPNGPHSNDPNFDFSLNIHPLTLRRLLDSYFDHIYVLQPFLDKPRLLRMIERFSMRYNPTEQKLTKALFSPQPSNIGMDALRNATAGGKRKHSGNYTQSFATDPSHTSSSHKQEILFERSISTAIVLLVMALGRMCEWKDPLPGVPRPKPHDGRATTTYAPRYQSPLHRNTQSPPANSIGVSPSASRISTSTSAPSPASLYRNSLLSPRSNVDDPLTMPRNIDIIPGLAYYAPATDILGNLHGSNDLAHVQAYLLAGLYIGQLARSFESFKWISSACVACRFLVRDPTLRKEKDPRKNMIKAAFWACLQLESDILAELDLPRSGIQDIRDVAYPNDYVEPADYHHWDSDKLVMGYYSGQIHIRNALNDIQKDLYAPENLDRATRGFALRNAFMETLRGWREALPPQLAWEDSEEPSTEINAARLRGKFYGAKYIIHRPFLRYALEHNLFTDTDSPVIHGQPHDRKNGVMPPPDTAIQIQRNEILKSCRTCIEAARQSTIAFDGIIYHQDRRLIVTNIFGTAHAQFGNMLVLAATHKSKSRTLSALVPAHLLSQLFERTINFLRSLVPLSETLERDMEILIALRELVSDSAAATHSFSSMDS